MPASFLADPGGEKIGKPPPARPRAGPTVPHRNRDSGVRIEKVVGETVAVGQGARRRADPLRLALYLVSPGWSSGPRPGW